jgi:hypothetical protein
MPTPNDQGKQSSRGHSSCTRICRKVECSTDVAKGRAPVVLTCKHGRCQSLPTRSRMRANQGTMSWRYAEKRRQRRRSFSKRAGVATRSGMMNAHRTLHSLYLKPRSERQKQAAGMQSMHGATHRLGQAAVSVGGKGVDETAISGVRGRAGRATGPAALRDRCMGARPPHCHSPSFSHAVVVTFHVCDTTGSSRAPDLLASPACASPSPGGPFLTARSQVQHRRAAEERRVGAAGLCKLRLFLGAEARKLAGGPRLAGWLAGWLAGHLNTAPAQAHKHCKGTAKHKQHPHAR